MSWLARSIANSLKLDDNDDDDEPNDVVSPSKPNHSQSDNPSSSIAESDDPSSPTSPSRGVREDLSELTKTLRSQFWGVASFLAPPPQSDPDPGADRVGSDSEGPIGIRSDFAELGGRFRSGISKLSNNMAVSEITKIATNILQLGSDEEDDESWNKGAVGVTEEVVAFARDVAMHPETWLDFPLPENDEDEDFEMSDAQQDHALAVEHLTPRLAALRIELCPGHMSEAHFWKIYFILVLPRLNKEDAEILCTPQIAEARASLGQELPKRAKANPKDYNDIPNEESLSVPLHVTSENLVQGKSDLESTSSASIADSDADKHPVTNTKIETVDKSVTEEGYGNKTKDETLHSASRDIPNDGDEDEEDADDWLKEESSEIQVGTKTTIPIENEDDVSFSDLEEEDDDMPTSYKKASSSSDKDSRDWVQLKKSSGDASKDVNTEEVNTKKHETKESNDWLDIDDIEVA